MGIINTDTGMLDVLLERIETKNYTVGIVGLGYVGLPLIVDTRNGMNDKGTTRPGQVWKA